MMFNGIIIFLVKEGSKARVVEERIQVENGEIRVKAYIPDSQVHEADGFPLILWMFGGGSFKINNLESFTKE